MLFLFFIEIPPFVYMVDGQARPGQSDTVGRAQNTGFHLDLNRRNHGVKLAVKTVHRRRLGRVGQGNLNQWQNYYHTARICKYEKIYS